MARLSYYPLMFIENQALLDDLEEKYSQENELGFFVSSTAGGLEDFENDLVFGPMAQRGYLLDIGCGAGREALAFSRLGYRVKAIDISQAMIDRAQASAQKEMLSVDFEKMSVTDLTFKDVFDYALFSSGVYNGIPTKPLRIASLSRVIRSVRPGGKVFVPVAAVKRSILSRGFFMDCLRRFLRRLFGERIAMEPGDVLMSKISPASDSRIMVFHHFFHSSREIEAELSACGYPAALLKAGLWQIARSR
jgi:SAM-dependent methyltransferase